MERRVSTEKIANALFEYALLLQEEEKYLEATFKFKECLALFRRLAEENPSVFKSKIADTRANLGSLYKILGYYSDAEFELKECLELYHSLAKELPDA
ncbi:MAG: tetratricopeptide repeat protein, partial [Thermoguttaceae bacterium]|nr:tetratricopeptide repeat protein [Thermoguttaceae bacterium]